MAKLTGDYDLEQSGRLTPFLADPGRFIREFSYEDRMKHLPVRDEQGTRDRPHILRMMGDAVWLGAALGEAGLEIWRGRPDIEVLLTVRTSRGAYLLGEEEEPSLAGQSILATP